MKNIRNYTPDKYNSEDYQKVEENIYKTLYSSPGSLEGLYDTELVNILKNLDGWIKEDNRNYTLVYEGKKYYILARDYEAGYKHKIWAPREPEEIYVTSLVFEQEPELGENEPADTMISQYPLEDILDKFFCFCVDFYQEKNASDTVNSYQEFASSNIENIRELLTIVGKHVYNKEVDGRIKLIIE